MCVRRDDPLDACCTSSTSSLYDRYFGITSRKSTKADSPIDLALVQPHGGVCQDFSHIMIAHGALAGCKHSLPLRERLPLPWRREFNDRSAELCHARLGGGRFCPEYGWVGFDSTNHLVAGDRHIRTAIGRDYADVPPTHGVFRGRTTSELSVAVRVTPSEEAPLLDQELPVPEDWSILVEKAQALPDSPIPLTRQQQMAQQQQQ